MRSIATNYMCCLHFIFVFCFGFFSSIATIDFEDPTGEPIYEPNSQTSTNTSNPLHIDSSIYHVCANVTYKAGNPDIRTALYDCVDNMADAQSIPSYLINASAVPVRVAFNINNLIEVNEIDASVSLDCFYRIYWVDPRWNFPDLWNDLAVNKPSILIDGIELRDFVRGSTALKIWLPLIYLSDAISISFTAETIRLRPGGVVFWSRHAIFTIQQSLLQYRQYPQDTQTFQIKCESYGSSSLYLDLNFSGSSESEKILDTYRLPKPVSFISNNGVLNIAINPIWRYLSFYTVIDSKNYGATGASASKNQLNLYLIFSRLNSGVINRLALPIMLMLLLVGLTFWSENANRISTTITLLLAVSAIYMVIFSSIPMLGYLTDFDEYILTMFLMLIVTVFVHALTSRLINKANKYPLRLLLVRILEGLGKVCVIPFVLLYFLFTFTDFGTEMGRIFSIALACVAVLVVGFREWVGFKGDVKATMTALSKKIDARADAAAKTDSTTSVSTSAGSIGGHRVTSIEWLVFNKVTFGIYSASADHFLQDKQCNTEVFSSVHSVSGDRGDVTNIGIDKRSKREVMLEKYKSEFHEL